MTKRYYVRKKIETDEVIVEKSDILDKEKYIITVATREDSDPFEMILESSLEYTTALKAFIAIETTTTVNIS